MIKVELYNQWKHLKQNFRGITIIGVTFFDIKWFKFSILRIEILGFSIDIIIKDEQNDKNNSGDRRRSNKRLYMLNFKIRKLSKL